MNSDLPSSNEPDDEGIPPKLRQALARLGDVDIAVPPAVDAEILSGAKSHYARRARFRPAIRWIAACASLAAAIAVGFVLRGTLMRPAVHLAKRGVNGNGKVDMLDAYLLARHLAAGDKVDPKWDVNGDGVIDQADVDWIANRAVQIRPNGPTTGGAQ